MDEKAPPVEALDDRARRRAAIEKVLEHLRQQPALNLPKVTRDEMYELEGRRHEPRPLRCVL
jgi:hypothetical protein